MNKHLFPSFELLIESYVEHQVGMSIGFLNEELAAHLKLNLLTLFKAKAFHSAGTGNQAEIVNDKLFRGDKIYWLDRNNNNKYEIQFLDLMDQFILYLNESCYTSISSCEFHYTIYEDGTFYKQHLDQFKNNESRQFSMIMYLNENWKIEDGGELCIQHVDRLQHIAPQNGTCVFFKSNELPHEVLMVNKSRMSITGWLKK